ncbi:remorin isoform X2 [Manduca sexta]|uniref:remorin isoform X2 n=1 Tax=Manduca sexta TaxID=7130 RepID=UPI00188EA520|nr:remorin isoform X2 [Manduca sexta]
MSDSVQSQEAGGGETVAPAPQAAPVAPAPEAPKPVEAPVPAPEAKVEDPKEVKEEVIPKVEEKPADEVKPEPVAASSAEQISIPEQKTEIQATNGDNSWQEREKQLLLKIEELEKIKNERTEDGLKLELKVREEEIDLLKARVKNLETELQAALSKPSGKNQEMIENIKQQHEELLSKARGMIFDKTKMVKNQELQIEALTTQVASLKDINQITKDLLEIRNGEVKAMEDRLQVMEARFKAEKNRYDLVLQRAQTSTNINDDLRKEYETQLAIFKELREKYEQRVQALVAENNKLKESVKEGTSS